MTDLKEKAFQVFWGSKDGSTFELVADATSKQVPLKKMVWVLPVINLKTWVKKEIGICLKEHHNAGIEFSAGEISKLNDLLREFDSLEKMNKVKK